VSASAFQLDAQADGVIAVRGVLTFDTAHAAWRALHARITAAPVRVLDLSAVERSDSAGLACVLAALAEARARGQSLQVRGLPAGMRRLAQVCEVESLLAA
jgi:phospholipid transport system transporter-binding protein